LFPFGSVPLKTYLPDGDIDLTAFGGASVEEALVNDVLSVLEAEDQNMAAEFIVKDVQLIRAEVYLSPQICSEDICKIINLIFSFYCHVSLLLAFWCA
ncbi:hypothetical protein U1Q18_050743, partial [Sarracenia purpurea var. burkii]